MNVALLTAAGSGTRMHQDIPKQFIHVEDKPVIIHTMEKFQKHPSIDAIICVTLESWADVLWAYAKQFSFFMLPIKVYVRQIKEHGIFNTIKIFSLRILNLLLNYIIFVFVHNRPLKNTIIIASHDDFDNNGGVFYDWLIKHKYNQKYKIVWLLKHMDSLPVSLPQNVECYSIYMPSFRRNYHICTARCFLADDKITDKTRKNQISVYCTHGMGSLKSPKGRIFIPNSVDYILMPAKTYMPIVANAFSMTYPNKKFISLGYPANDYMYCNNDVSELLKITIDTFRKVVIWMPTFRKSIMSCRNDSSKATPLGIPLIMSFKEYLGLNEWLKSHDMLMIMKLHLVADLKIKTLSNMIILTHRDMKKKEINLYKLLSTTDVLISDYSSAAGDYLHLDRPIAYVFDDINEYKIDLISDDIEQVTAGNFIYNLSDMFDFLNDVYSDIDCYSEKRHKLRDFIFEYKDGDSCNRLAEFKKL